MFNINTIFFNDKSYQNELCEETRFGRAFVPIVIKF